MAVEDGKMFSFDEEKLKKLIESRTETFETMMKEIEEKDYSIINIREEAGFCARLAIKKTHKEKRGILIICPGGGFLFKSWNEAVPVAEYFYKKDSIPLFWIIMSIPKEKTHLKRCAWQGKTAWQQSDI